MIRLSSRRSTLSLLALVLMTLACGQESLPEQPPSDLRTTRQAHSTNRVLILGTTVSGDMNSPEALAALSLGYQVEIVGRSGWLAKTSADFATYRALILGDAFCQTLDAVMPAVNNRSIWGPVVDGNIIVIGTDPVYHRAQTVSNNAVEFAAAQAGKTGMYISLSCYYHGTTPVTPVPLLDQFGAFTVTGVGCYNNVHMVASHPALNDLTDASLSNWHCSVHEAFDGYPAANFTPLAIALDPSSGPRLPGSRDFADGTHGAPYILVHGAIPVRCGDSVTQPPEECDTGTVNGVPGTPCSSTCRLHWCGDAVQDSGEECDQGASNGAGACSASCRLVAHCGNSVVEPGEECDDGANNGHGACSATCRWVIVDHAPTAQCQNLHLMADTTCGASGSIDNGSSDPDGDLVGCTQSPPGAYPLGETHVTLTCIDLAGHISSCMSHVEVEDATPPALACPTDSTAECVGGAAVVAPGAATATDNCGATSVSPSGGPATFPQGTTAVTYSATDASGNTTTCTSHVTVADTLAPQLQLLPGPSVIACGGEPYADPGATASDLCEGDLTGAITVSSNLDPSRVGDYTITYRVADGAGHVATAVRALAVRGTSLHLSDYNLFLLEDYTGGHDVVGKVAAGGNITLTDFAVGSGLPDSDISRTLVAGGNLTLSRGAIWGDAFYGGSYTTDPSVLSFRGSVARGTPIDFAARFAELRGLSSRLAGIPANGTTTREGWGGLMLRGTSPTLNVFRVDASAFTGAKLLSIEAPADSLVVVNIHGASATLTGFGHALSGGIDAHGILYNFADATAINANGFGFSGTVLAPYAHITFNNGCWDGGIYAKSLTGNAEGHINPLSDREFCQ